MKEAGKDKMVAMKHIRQSYGLYMIRGGWGEPGGAVRGNELMLPFRRVPDSQEWACHPLPAALSCRLREPTGSLASNLKGKMVSKCSTCGSYS